MQKITFNNAKGNTITLSDTFPYLVQSIEGLGAPESNPMLQKGYQQDGVSYYGSLLSYRMISFQIIISNKVRDDLLTMRENIFKVFNPRLGEGTLTYSNNVDNSYSIKCTVAKGPIEILSGGYRNSNMQAFSVTLLCASPAWEKELSTTPVEMVGFEGGVEFGEEGTFMLGTEDGLVFGEQGDVAQIEYNGTLSAPVEIEFNGPVELPKITNIDTGEFIEVSVELLEGEKLKINTDKSGIEVKKIEADGAEISAYNYINPLSSYFVLTEGINNLMFTVATGNPVVKVDYKERYVGV